MTSTSVVYDLIARDKASRTMRGVADSSSRTEKAFSRLGKVAKTAGKAVGLGMLAGTAVFVKNAVSLEAQFGKTMNLVQANSGATGKQMKQLSALAIKMGRDTVFSASDAADAMLELSKGGLKPATIQAGALKSAMNLAAAGQLDMATAANTTVKAMGAFGLKGKQTKQIANALAGAANASAADVSDLSMALAQGGLSAHNAGLTIQETTGILAAFANAGIRGTDAGTSLKTMLTRLQPTTKSASLAMQSVGLWTEKSGSAFVNANGTFKSAAQIAGILHDHLKGLSDAQRSAALTTIFGSDAQRAATVLYNEGAKGVRKYEKATKDSRAAQKMAQAGMKGTAGMLEQLKGSLETVELQFGMMAKPVVQYGLKLATKAINGIGGALDNVSAKLKPLEHNIGDFFGGLAGQAAKTKTVKAGPLFAGGPSRLVQQMLPPSSARQMGTRIRSVITAALTGGVKGVNWHKLGGIIGNGFTKALSDLGKLATSLTAKFGALMAKIDWVALGTAVGKTAIPFAIGFINSLLDPLFSGTFWKKHWLDLLLAVASFIPIGKFAGILGKVVEKIPILKAFAPLLKGMDKLAGFLWKGIKKLLGFLGKGFMAGFREVFPEVGKAFEEGLSLLPTKLGVLALDLVEKAKAMLVKFGLAILKAQTWPMRQLGKLVAKIFKFFAPAAKWLLKPATAMVKGFAKAVTTAWRFVERAIQAGWRLVTRLTSSGTKAVVNFVKKLPGQIGHAIASFGRLLTTPIRAAWNLANSLTRGRLNDLVGVVRSIPGRIASLGGRMLSAGRSLMGRLFDGIRSAAGAAGSFAAGIADAIVRNVKSLLNNILPHHLSINKGPIHISVPLFPYLAKGTNYWPGGRAIVGENGAELVDLPRGSRVHPADETARILKGARGDVTVNVYGQDLSSPSKTGREVARQLRFAGVA